MTVYAITDTTDTKKGEQGLRLLIFKLPTNCTQLLNNKMNKYNFFVVYICVSRDRLLKFPWRHLVLISLATLKKTHKQLLFSDKIRKTLDERKDNSVLAKPLAASTHLCSTVFQLFEPQVKKIAFFTYRSPHFCFPWRRPCDYHAICSINRKTIQCLPNPSQYVPIYLQ